MTDAASSLRRGFWNALNEEERAAVRAAARPRGYAPKMPLCYQGDESDHIIIIESGWAKVTSATEDGYDVVLAVRGPGDLVGESAMLGRRRRSATVTALSPVQALVVSAARFSAFLDEHPHVWRMLSATLVGRLDAAENRLQAHARSSSAQRLALLLVYLADLSELYAPAAKDGSVEIRPPLSQEELASWVDASRETVARALHSWRRRGLIRTGWRRLVVVDRVGLHRYAHAGAIEPSKPDDRPPR